MKSKFTKALISIILSLLLFGLASIFPQVVTPTYGPSFGYPYIYLGFADKCVGPQCSWFYADKFIVDLLLAVVLGFLTVFGLFSVWSSNSKIEKSSKKG